MRYVQVNGDNVVTRTLDISDPTITPAQAAPGTTGWITVAAPVRNGWVKQADGTFKPPAP